MSAKLRPDTGSKAEIIAKKYFPCTCGEIYLSRKLTAPDCPYHAFDWEEAMIEYANVPPDTTPYLIYNNDKVNSILSAALKNLSPEQLSILRECLIERTPAAVPVPNGKYWVEKSIIDDGIPEGKDYIFHRIGQGRASTLKYLVPVSLALPVVHPDKENVISSISSNLYNIRNSSNQPMMNTDKCDEIAEFIYNDLKEYFMATVLPIHGYSLEDMENAFEAGESLQYFRDMGDKDGFHDLGKPKEFSEFIYPPATAHSNKKESND